MDDGILVLAGIAMMRRAILYRLLTANRPITGALYLYALAQ
jgi:hypothetical protein